MQPRLLLYIILSVCFTAGSAAQKLSLEHFREIKIRNIGPAGMSGRITTIDVVNSQPHIIFVGTASGGVWRSTSGGTTWAPVFDGQPVQSIGALAINQRNPSEIWVGTGEGNPRNSHNSGEGIFRSLDGGKSWTRMGLENTRTIHRIILHRDNPDIIHVAALGSAWGPNEERGVFRSTDGGHSWEKVLYVNDSTGCADLVVDPANPNKLIAAMWDYGRKPWTFYSGGAGSGLYVTFDGGDSWTKRTSEDGLPSGNLGRMGLAIAPSSPNIVYALIEAKVNALYRSEDGGFKWKKVSDEDIGNRPFYYADIFVDPHNENRIYNLWSRLSRSEDGGKTFERIARGTHADHHAFWVHPDDPNYLIEGNDGGLNISRDGGETWRFVRNLPIGQFYHINVDMDVPYNIGGGLQDNGSWVGPSAAWNWGGLRNHDWQRVGGGDGFDVVFRPGDNRYVYSMYQGGNVSYIDRKTGDSRFIKPVHPDGEELRFNWNAAIAQDPFNACGIYFGSQFLHKSTDCGESWEIISPDLTTNDPEKQKQNESGGLTIDDTRAENFTTIVAIAPSPMDENVIWVGTDDGNLQLTRDGGQSWVNLASRLPDARPGSWIPFIEVSRRNRGEAFVVVNDYRRNDWRPMVYHTTDFGESFTRIVDENKVSGHALAVRQDKEAPELLFLGTGHGLYISIDGGGNWTKWTNGFPSAPTRDLVIHPRDQDLVIGTFGRSVWILDDIRPLREVARTKGQVLEQPLRAFDAPDAYLAGNRLSQGVSNPADGDFRGDNRGSDAMLTVWVKPEDRKKDSKTEGEEPDAALKLGRKIKFRVVNAKGDTIRTFTEEAKPGMARYYWGLRQDGVRFPSRRNAGPDDDPPRGQPVLPGQYKLLVSCGDFSDSTVVTVHKDPLSNETPEDLQAQHDVYDRYYAIVEKAAEAFHQLQEAAKTIDRVEKALANAPDSTRKEVGALGKSLKDSLAMLEELYMLPEDFKGIRRSTGMLNSTLWEASAYIRTSGGQLSGPAQLMMEQAKAQTAEVLERINAFFANDFAIYRQKVEAVKYSLFEEYEPVRLE
ncbi:MAG: hypothetical protein H6558_03835 [Lewinellaceae bacterium]|nr:hypothetical protein [Lewinellaceae bacterium]